MLDYQRYIEVYNGTADKEEFQQLLLLSKALIQGYAESFISQFKLRDNFEDYGLNIEHAICAQIDFTSGIGGISVYNGRSELDIETVQTSGFTYHYGSGNAKTELFNGIPVSGLSVILVKSELRRRGYLGRWVYA